MALQIIEGTNELIKQYFCSYRFYNTLAGNDREEQYERDFRVQVDRIVSGIVKFMETYDIDSLISIWEFFNTKLFNNMDEYETRMASKLEADIFKLYITNCVQNKQTQKCVYFYEKMSSSMANNKHWTDWYALPYIVNASSQEPYRNYFSKQWHELLLVSLHNFVANRIDKLCKPPLVNPSFMNNETVEDGSSNGHVALRHSLTTSLMDDFTIIAQRSVVKSTQSKSSLKNVLRSITGRRSED
ncbi:WD repeat-containing protein 91 [Aphelenchoides besseyi]|nr:WD repeat-containing protein 91 [Aphelenchoides besseyi]KAI6234959.1 WD repeat-containing protein 91 [Aphelenchoides besseyi]